MPVEQSDTPIRALKVANLATTLNGRSIRLYPLHTFGVEHQADATAACMSYWKSMAVASGAPMPNSGHDVPDVACACGFYALKEPADLDVDRPGSVIIDVELSGRVIECERGYRAAKQRILAVRVPRGCCGWLCDQPATLVAFEWDDDNALGVPYCTIHGDKFERTALLAEVAGVLGTEVRWTD